MAEFFELKLRTLFKRFDFDGNGSIEESDFNNWANNLIALGNLNEEKANNLRLTVKQLWSIHFAPADKDGNGNVSYEEFFAFFKEVPLFDNYFLNGSHKILFSYKLSPWLTNKRELRFVMHCH